MNFSKKIKEFEKKGFISRKPNPIFPFILSFISLSFGILTSYINIEKVFSHIFFFLAGFGFIFAVLHLIVVKILES